jgi:hypothetical protein
MKPFSTGLPGDEFLGLGQAGREPGIYAAAGSETSNWEVQIPVAWRPCFAILITGAVPSVFSLTAVGPSIACIRTEKTAATWEDRTMTQFLVFAALLAIWPLGSGKDYRMTAEPQVPAANGSVKVTRDKDNGNTAFDIKVHHLALPSSLTPPESVYLVWVQPRDAAPVKQGALGVDKALKGEFKSVTVSKDFDLFITAEQSENIAAPAGAKVLQVHINVS